MKVSGKRIQQARLAAGLTQAQLARLADTSERNVVRWENNQNVPRMKHLLAVARATGNGLEAFLSPDDAAEEEEDATSRLRRIRAELILAGRDDLADDLRKLVSFSEQPEKPGVA